MRQNLVIYPLGFNSKMYRPAGLALLIGVYIVICCLSFRSGLSTLPRLPHSL